MAVGLLSAAGCVSIHNEYPGEQANMGETPVPPEVPAQAEVQVQTVVLEKVTAPAVADENNASSQVDILKDAKKPCSSVADDAGKFKK